MLQGRQSDTAGELLHGKDSALDSDQRPQTGDMGLQLILKVMIGWRVMAR